MPGLGRTADAREALEKAWTLRKGEDGEPETRAATAFALAQALGRSERGRELTELALKDLEGLGSPRHKAQGVAEVRAWLRGNSTSATATEQLQKATGESPIAF